MSERVGRVTHSSSADVWNWPDQLEHLNQNFSFFARPPFIRSKEKSLEKTAA